MFKLEKESIDKDVQKTKKITDVVWGSKTRSELAAERGVDTVIG